MDANTNPNGDLQPTIESVESNPQSDVSAIVTDPDWEAVGGRVLSELADAVEIIRTAGDGDPIHDWTGVENEWTAKTRPDATSVCLEHSSGAWVRIEASSVSDGFNVLVSEGSESIPQRALWSTRTKGYLLQKCETQTVAKILQYTRDGEF
ncbi:hypothetical protein [Natronorubrum sp. FCH18a]|uniref:hypothetical protein n=1 Tax=Natronorubrum sp. FCH18a TaxID=3447018 RepID=UPI003F511F12